MAGHSKWANIKHRKGRQDAARGKVFTKLIRAITLAARQGADIDGNAALRLAVDKALVHNMTRDTIERAIKRGSGSNDAEHLTEVFYEGYAAGGVAILVHCLTDNRNRTVGEIRHIFTKCGGHLGAIGSVAYLFKQQGFICLPPGSDEEQVMQLTLDVAEDIVVQADGSIEIFTAVENFSRAKTAIETSGFVPAIAQVSMVATTKVTISEENYFKFNELIDKLEDLDDVQNVYFNLEYS